MPTALKPGSKPKTLDGKDDKRRHNDDLNKKTQLKHPSLKTQGEKKK
jgi:hypothetical protein